jgi:cobalt-zinc-cadmium efflux system membrane fusion protein
MRHGQTRSHCGTACFLACVVGTAAALGTAFCFGHEDHAPLPTKGVTIAGNNILLSDKARVAIGLTTAKVTFGDLHRTVEVNAKVELPWSQRAMITSLVPGKIDRVLVRPGERVAAGQELARVVSMELESLQLALLQAAGNVALARQLVEQRTVLDQQGVIAGKSLLEARSTLAEKTAAVRISEQKLLALGLDTAALEQIRSAGMPLLYVPITSPIAGVITHADVRVGQVVALTDHLYHVVDPSQVWIVGEVLESDVRHLKRGQEVTASFAAHHGKTFRGQIDHVRLKMDRRTRTQSVVILVDNQAGLLWGGMFGRVSIAVRVAKEAIVCPADAVLKSRSGTYVLVERSPGKYENRLVKLGLQKGDRVEVLEGVFPGDKVVVTGAYLLASLLGNEHKARTTGGRGTNEPETAPTSERPVAMADATIELPTSRQAFATARIEGRIRRILVAPSQRVDAGQVLAEVDSLELRTAQLDLLQSLARLRLARQSLDRLAELGDRGTTPRRRIWELENEHQSLANRVESLKRQLAFYGLTQQQIGKLEQADLVDPSIVLPLLESVPIRAPAAGWIVGFNVVPGQVVHSRDQLFEIHNLSTVWVKGYVFERDAARVAVGQPARVTFSAFPDMEAVGKVVRIAPTMEEGERVLPVWVELDNADRLLKEGMLARVIVLAHSASVGEDPAEVAELKQAKPRR